MTDIVLTNTFSRYLSERHPEVTLPHGVPRFGDMVVNTATLDDTNLRALCAACATVDLADKTDKAAAAVITAVLRTRGGDEKPIVALNALPAMLSAWVDLHCQRGWVIRKDIRHQGRDQVLLVKDAIFKNGSRETAAQVNIQLVANSPGLPHQDRGGSRIQEAATSYVHIRAEDLFSNAETGQKRRRRTIPSLLESLGLFPADAEDIAAHDTLEDEFLELLATGFAQQYHHTGRASYNYSTRFNENTKVIHDVAPDERAAVKSTAIVWGTDGRDVEPISRRVPTTASLRVFDLPKQVLTNVDMRDLTPYVYDASLREKLILPATHRELLDVLTTDLEDYADDIVEGKGAGNVILAQGRPGVGKTLTAEVYAELVERPLYSIHSGSLGTSAESVRQKLEEVFARSARWGAVLLLDEADVFVIARGQSVEQNAIVAEFLRTLEYFGTSGLLFMTTNRSDEIDDAVLSRCAAIIQYEVPSPQDAKRVWQVLVANAGATELVGEDLIETLVATYPRLAPRDVKMVLRLALRIAAKRGGAPTLEIFQRCLLFRGLTDAAEHPQVM